MKEVEGKSLGKGGREKGKKGGGGRRRRGGGGGERRGEGGGKLPGFQWLFLFPDSICRVY